MAISTLSPVSKQSIVRTMSVCLSVCLSVCMSLCVFVCLSVCLFVCLSVCLCVCVCRSICLCVCLSVHHHVSRNTRLIFTKCFVCVAYCRGSVVLWRLCDTLCTSCFMDDVMFAHRPRQLIVAAQLMEAQPTGSLGLGYKWHVGIPVAGQSTHTHGPTFRAPMSGPAMPQWAC